MRRLALARTCALVFGVLLVTGHARADRRTETAALDALKRADDDYLQTDFAKALRRLQVAERACGEASCTSATHAALLRDIGTMEFRLGHADVAANAFRRANKLDAAIKLNPDYDAKDLRAAWEAALASATAPVASGDFVHRPAAAQSATTPLPVYVETANADVRSVVVKYRGEGMRSFRRAVLQPKGGGWGGYVPCADVVAGTLRYYIQGFDKDGELAASSGDPTRTFEVPIRSGSVGNQVDDAPSLPGEPAPVKCGAQDTQVLNLDRGERCTEDRQCKSGTCGAGRCSAVPTFEQEEPPQQGSARPRARFWIGIAGTLDLTAPPSGTEVCAPGSGYWCTTPEGSDLPANPALVPHQRGIASSELSPGGVHVLATLDYAATANLLLGVRLGYVANAYPGDAASAAGKTLAAALHAEARGTWVFGDEPIARSGLAPYVFVAAGVAHFDAPVTVMVAQQGVAGARAVHAWFVSGPAFGGAGGGARYAFSPRIAFSTGIGLDAGFGPGAFGLTVSPELSVQYGF
jgi:hypothetical protein